MAVGVIQGSVDTFNGLCYAPKHPSTIQFLEQGYQNATQYIRDAAGEFAQRAAELHKHYNVHEAMRRAKSAIRAVANVFKRDEIMPLRTIDEVQHSGLVMQRWNMAEPMLRELYQAQQCDGYSGSYVDVDPGVRGEDHYDYRRVMEGMIQMSPPDENGEESWKVDWYFEELREGDKQLAVAEVQDIRNAWGLIQHGIKDLQVDPSDPLGGML